MGSDGLCINYFQLSLANIEGCQPREQHWYTINLMQSQSSCWIASVSPGKSNSSESPSLVNNAGATGSDLYNGGAITAAVTTESAWISNIFRSPGSWRLRDTSSRMFPMSCWTKAFTTTFSSIYVDHPESYVQIFEVKINLFITIIKRKLGFLKKLFGHP